MTIYQKIEEFFVLASVADSEKKQLFPEASNLGLHSFGEWESLMEMQLSWMKHHSDDVLLNLAPLRDAWPECCKALEQILS